MKNPGVHGLRNRDGDIVPSAEEIRKSCFHDERALLRKERGRATQRFCKTHHKWERIKTGCSTWNNRAMPKTFRPYWDPNLGGKAYGGMPVFVRSAQHKKQLLRANGLTEAG